MTGPVWDGDGKDPWLPHRLEAILEAEAAERTVYEAVWAALSAWLVATSRRVFAGSIPDPDVIFSRAPSWDRDVADLITRVIIPIMDHAYAALLGGDFSWRERPNVVAYLAGVRNRLVGVPNEVFNLVAGQVAAGVTLGDGIPEIADRVDLVLSTTKTERWPNRAVVIARTETLGALNGSRADAFSAFAEESEEELERMWLSTIDTRTRPTHVAADQQRVDLGDPFMVGGFALAFPGDPAGPPARGHPVPLYDALAGKGRKRGSVSPAAKEELTMATRFRTLACPVDAPTGDRRRFADGSLTSQPLPMPMRWVRADVGAHDGAVTLGAIQDLEIDGTDIWVSGTIFDDVDRAVMPRLAEDVAEAMKLIVEGVLGLSVDLDDAEMTFVREGTDDPITEEDLGDPDLRVEELITQGRIRSATLVAIPAFVETNHTFDLTQDEEPAEDVALVASLSGSTDLPVADRGMSWDGDAAAGRVFDAYSDADGVIDKAQAGRAFLWVDGDGAERGDYKLGFADLVDGELAIIPAGVAATAAGHGVDATDLSDADKDAVKGRICSLYATVRAEFEDWPDCPFDDSAAESASTESLIAALGVAEALRPFSAFTPPITVTGPVPMTYDFTASPPVAYGHILTWNTCHEGFRDVCIVPPRDPDGEYRDFHVHPIETDAGPMFAGRITAGGVHASEGPGTDAHFSRRHHDEMDTVAYVRATPDEFGLFLCGPIEPGLSEETRAILSRRKVSGDWRETSAGLSLIEVLALKPGPRATSEPGFPVTFSFRRGRQVSLCAALGPEAGESSASTGIGSLDLAQIFRTAYETIREEDAVRVEAERVAANLRESLAADAAQLAGELLERVEG